MVGLQVYLVNTKTGEAKWMSGTGDVTDQVRTILSLSCLVLTREYITTVTSVYH